jgi:hypothetical protein
MGRGEYKLDIHQINVAKYALLTNRSINSIRQDLFSHYDNPIYDKPQLIPTKYLNRVVITNLKTSLKSFQQNPQGRSTYKPLPEGYSPLQHYHYHLRHGCNYQQYLPLTQAQFNSQFEPPTAAPSVEPEEDKDDDYHSANNNMVRFSHLYYK